MRCMNINTPVPGRHNYIRASALHADGRGTFEVAAPSYVLKFDVLTALRRRLPCLPPPHTPLYPPVLLIITLRIRDSRSVRLTSDMNC